MLPDETEARPTLDCHIPARIIDLGVFLTLPRLRWPKKCPTSDDLESFQVPSALVRSVDSTSVFVMDTFLHSLPSFESAICALVLFSAIQQASDADQVACFKSWWVRAREND
jgi:hypothetical protein